MTITSTRRPVFTAPEDSGYVDLPFHELEISTHQCVHCGESPEWNSYADYYNYWYGPRREDNLVWSGEGFESYPEPEDEEAWEYLNATCLSLEG